MSDFKEYRWMEGEYNVQAAVENLRKAYWSNETEKVAKHFTEAEDIIISAICHHGYIVCKETTEGDLISREALKAKMFDIPKPREDVTFWDGVDIVGNLIDNAPVVEPFTQKEKEEIVAAIKYLLGAELLEENGYTEEVINALKSALKKVGGKEE